MTADDLTTARLDVPIADVEARLRAGRLSEYAHLLHDADPDSTIPVFPDLAKGRRDLDPDLVASLGAKLMTPVVWGEEPERHRPEGYDPTCEPTWAPSRDVTDVETGGAL